MQLCRYEDFVADKAGTIFETAEALGYPVLADLAGRLDYPFQPGGDKSATRAEFFGPENQARIEAICGEGMAALNYPREAQDC